MHGFDWKVASSFTFAFCAIILVCAIIAKILNSIYDYSKFQQRVQELEAVIRRHFDCRNRGFSDCAKVDRLLWRAAHINPYEIEGYCNRWLANRVYANWPAHTHRWLVEDNQLRPLTRQLIHVYSGGVLSYNEIDERTEEFVALFNEIVVKADISKEKLLDLD